ncbi:hypothetical protein FHX08_006122 [Rhizobium sp. BK529]|nr:hypothetical protein [Rhizobium sp. BK529]TCR98258.1 hypothetical protein EV281_10965 [Rhizobium sp. BK418]
MALFHRIAPLRKKFVVQRNSYTTHFAFSIYHWNPPIPKNLLELSSFADLKPSVLLLNFLKIQIVDRRDHHL